MWGFIVNICGIVMALIQFVQVATKSALILKGCACLGCPIGCGGLAWFIAGMVLRWRHIGKVCAGDYNDDSTLADNLYMTKSGNFMNIFLIICLCLMGLTCCSICCIVVILNAKARN